MKRGNGAKRFPCALAILLSAFLLFHMQMLLGKQMLPFLGGAPAVWTACLLLFPYCFLQAMGTRTEAPRVLLAHDPGSLSGDELGKESELFPAETRRIFRTDDYCDLLHVLRRQKDRTVRRAGNAP